MTNEVAVCGQRNWREKERKRKKKRKVLECELNTKPPPPLVDHLWVRAGATTIDGDSLVAGNELTSVCGAVKRGEP